MKSKKLHLSLLMFFQLCAVGTYVPILSIYLKEFLGFSSMQVGVILSVASIPSILIPFISAWIVDRVITSRKFLAICHFGAAILILVLSFEKSYALVLITYLLYTILLVPTFALVNALIFHNMNDSHAFGSIRVWGTIGWVLSGWLISLILKTGFGLENKSIILQLSALFSLIIVILTLKLPKLRLEKQKKVSIIPKEALDVVKQPAVKLIYLLVFINSITDRFLSYGLPIFLSDNGTAESNIIFIISLGQMPEIFMLFTLGGIIKKLGFKNIFTSALILQCIRYTIFYINGPMPLTIFGIIIHGFIYAFFYAAATIYLDNFCSPDSRGGIHQLFTLTQVGLAGLLGNFTAGWVAESFSVAGNIDFKSFWIIPVIISFISLIILAIGMQRTNNPSKII